MYNRGMTIHVMHFVLFYYYVQFLCVRVWISIHVEIFAHVYALLLKVVFRYTLIFPYSKVGTKRDCCMWE
jgi:hypothetical protein